MSNDELSKLKIWVLAARPKTLPAALSPVFVGTAVAYHNDFLELLPAVMAGLGAILLQILANYANDYFDYLKGFDTEDRVGPLRVAASGLLSPTELRNGLIITTSLSTIIGLYLIWVGGWIILGIGIFSIIFAFIYSGGPFPLTSNGLGDLFVFIFFGLIAVNGTYYVQALRFDMLPLIASIPVGLLVTSILVVNNYRDIDNDRATGKRTLAVIMGAKYTQLYYVILLLISYFIPIVLNLLLDMSSWVLLPLFSLPLAFKQTRLLFTVKASSLNDVLAGTAQLSMIYSFLLSLGIIL